MQELARDPNTSGPLTTSILSQLANMNNQQATVGVNIIDMNAIEDSTYESL